ncbi:MAG: hypothetical protein CL607_01965 [Anaerolineaceae bacterium]|nr:hypothetical protein [Anaerolineaceae bacterium]
MRVPDWLPNPLGRYYLYFAHHSGDFIRLAYSDDLTGPYTVHEPGTLHLSATPCHGHIASPDLHVLPDTQEIRMYFHGPVAPERDGMAHFAQEHPILGHQRTFVATSKDGIHFKVNHSKVLGTSYFRVWQWHGTWYALGMPGILYRSHDGGLTFEAGKQLFPDEFRHAAVALDGDVLSVYYSLVGDCPERIRCSTIALSGNWTQWQASPPIDVLSPAEAWEGADLPIEASARGFAKDAVHQLRDPAIYDEEGQRYLLYSFAGEQGIGLTRL